MSYLTDLREQGLEINTRGDWRAVFDYSNLRTIYLPGDYLFLHISVTNRTDDWRADMRTIERIGISRFPNTGISYNAAAFPDGRIADAQPLDRRGAHTLNELGVPGYPENLNYYGHAIVLPQMVGDPVTNAQVDAVAQWGAAVVRAGYSRADRFLPHRMFAPKDCPGDRAVARLDDINGLLRHYVQEGLPVITDADVAKIADKTVATLLNTRVDKLATPDDPTDKISIRGLLEARIDRGITELLQRDPVQVDAAAIANRIIDTLGPNMGAQLVDELQRRLQA